MKPEEAKILLQKYFEGETSLEEEKKLRLWFLQDELPGEFTPFRKWFAGIAEQEESIIPDPFAQEMARFIGQQQKPVRFLNRKMIITFSGIAASVIIVLGSLLFYLKEPDYRDTFSDPAEAIAYAEKTMGYISDKYNQGLATLKPAGRLKEGQLTLGKNLKTIRKGFTEYNKIQFINKLKTEN